MSEINYSEFSALTQCERKWAYAYVLGQEEEGPRRGLKLGTLIHLWHSRWLSGEGATLPSEWTDDINTGGKPGEVRTLCLNDFDSELVERATWLAGRFAECYGPQPPSSWNVIGAEQWINREFPWGTLVGRTDGFVEIDGQLWLIEVKSYSSRPGPLAYAQVSPQLGCYSLLAEGEFGQRPFGILYQGVYTYEWQPKVPSQKALIEAAGEWNFRTLDGELIRNLPKKDQQAWAKAMQQDPNWWEQRPAAESFEQIQVELGSDHLRSAWDYLEAATRRRDQLAKLHISKTLPNIGAHCRACGFRAQCWSDLGGVEEFEIEVEDDKSEPV